MQASDITYSFPFGPTYQDEDGNKVLVIALPSDTKLSKFIGIRNDNVYPFDAEELDLYIEKPDAELTFKESVLRKAIKEVLNSPTPLSEEDIITQVIQRLSDS